MPNPFAGIFDPREKLSIGAVHIFALWGFAVAEPLYDIFAQYADFFVAHHAQPLDIVLLAFVLSFGAPLLLFLSIFLAGTISKKIGGAVYHGVLSALVMLLVLLFLKEIGSFHDIYIMAMAAFIAVGFLYTYLNFIAVRSVMTWIGISIVIFPIQFLTLSSVQQIVFPEATVEDTLHIVESEIPIVFIVFEELPLVSLLDENNLLDSVRYPNFYKLAQKSHWFRNYTVNAAKTKLSVPTILTGKYATHSRLMLLENYSKSLFTLLHPTYKIFGEGLSVGLIPKSSEVQEGAPPLLSSRHRVSYMLLDMSMVYLHMIAPKRLASQLPPVTDNWNNFFGPEPLSNLASAVSAKENKADKVSVRSPKDYMWKGAAFAYFMESLGKAPGPALYFLHSTFAHNPWVRSTSGRTYGERNLPGYLREKSTVNAVFGFGGKLWSEDEWLVTQGYQRHLLEVSYIDTMLGQAMQRLESLDLFDKSLIIITADHGCSFEPGDRNRGRLETVPGDTMAVPLLIKLPNQNKGVISDGNTESIDLLPTIADILDIDLAWSVDGHSMFNNAVAKRDQKTLVFSDGNEKMDRLLVSGANENRDSRLQKKLTIFGSGHTKPSGYFQIGQYGSLVGRKVIEFPKIAESEESMTLRFNEHHKFVDVDLGNPMFIPVHVSGTILGGVSADETVYVAVEINGKIAATTRSFSEPSSDGIQFYAMLAEQVLIKGNNEVNFFVISTDEDNRVVLSPVIQKNQ